MLTVNEGDTVRITIIHEDFIHNWALYPGGTPAEEPFVGNPLALHWTDSVTSSNPTASTTFTAPALGTYEYFCEFHADTMHGTFVVKDPPPVVTFASPTAGTSWTGGSTHAITFEASDDEPLTTATMWVNYTSSDGSGPVDGPLPVSASNQVSWNAPSSVDAADVRVNVSIVDGAGVSTYTSSPAFEIDSTAPVISTFSPANGQIDVPTNAPVRVTFSEGMDRAVTGTLSTFGVLNVPAGEWLPGTFEWSTDSRVLTFTPAANLEPLTTYRAHVNTTAEDDSDPGNTIPTPEVWNFVTGSGADTTSPTIASVAATPASQVEGGAVNITADVTDDVAIDRVLARVVGPDLDIDLTMQNAGGTVWYANRSYGTKGSYSYTVTAMDTSGNSQLSGGTFTIIDVTSPPRPLALDAIVQPNGTVKLTWSVVTAADLVGYIVYRAEGSGGLAPVTPAPLPASGPAEYYDTTVRPGATYRYAVTSVDGDDNESPHSPEVVVTVPLPLEGFDPTVLYVAGGALAAIAVGALALLLVRRKRKP